MGENFFRCDCKPDFMILHLAFEDVKDVSYSTTLLVSIKWELSSKSTNTRKFLQVAIAHKHNFLDQISHDIVVKQGVELVFDFFLHLCINKFWFGDKLEILVLSLLTFQVFEGSCPMLRDTNVWFRGLHLWVELSHSFAVDDHLGNLLIENSGRSIRSCSLGSCRTFRV